MTRQLALKQFTEKKMHKLWGYFLFSTIVYLLHYILQSILMVFSSADVSISYKIYFQNI